VSGPDRIGVAVLGSGAIARDHVRALAALPELRVVLVCGSDLGRARSVAALAYGAEATTDPELAIADPRVQAVDVCGSTAVHARWTVRAGQLNKHVLVEKPVALSLQELQHMLTATEGSSLLVGQTVRFQPAVAQLRAEVASGSVGTPRVVHITWHAGHVWPGGWRGWQHDPAMSGGHPVHNGTHAFDLVAWLTGRRPVRVFTRSFASWSQQMDVPDSFHVTIRLDDDSVALVDLSYALRRPGDTFRRVVVIGTRGTLVHSTADDVGLTSEGSGSVPVSVLGTFDAQMRHWQEVLSGQCEPITRPVEIRAALAGALAAQESLVTGQPVNVDGRWSGS
jgi:predicted dehydrogenase